ncbi:Similar to Uncharacterized methyltransferase ABP140; acc. no. Q08641 [Pyronema omphalodes CBS 100304]|uniref:tRNA N(3)-methylcytidine methyltransferase n=1 Tax=Pyronema omphalodes (strain CBS 100304) TaxID=1076935 RepID=U4LL31_PYROM|nr:Similar to Uncharacterized methyltransferase ABP140; acc. no. Q08641 [Pyronema omphalodes CBS 100304]
MTGSTVLAAQDALPDVAQLKIEPETPSSGVETPREETEEERAFRLSGPKNTEPFSFGSRVLLPTDDPFAHNAWDHVEIDDEYKEFTLTQIEKQRANPVSDFDKGRFNGNPAKWWDIFYKNNRENFFKDRKWLQQEFPILSEATKADYGPALVVELGCGAGNTLFPVVKQNENKDFVIHGCDFATNAVNVVKAQELYGEHNINGNVFASVYDLSQPDTLPDDIQPGTVDIVIMVFVFSALAPNQWISALRNIRSMLKPGGKVLFRDYGRGDLAQVRFKTGRYLDENFYIRGDGTRVYFFEEDQLREMFSGEFTEGSDELPEKDAEDGYGGFSVESLGTDKRMLVNRHRKLKMYRRWMQAVFVKL